MNANARVCLYDLQVSREIFPYFKLKIHEFRCVMVRYDVRQESFYRLKGIFSLVFPRENNIFISLKKNLKHHQKCNISQFSFDNK